MCDETTADIINDLFASIVRHVWHHGCCNCLEHLRTAQQQVVLGP